MGEDHTMRAQTDRQTDRQTCLSVVGGRARYHMWYGVLKVHVHGPGAATMKTEHKALVFLPQALPESSVYLSACLSVCLSLSVWR